MKKKSLLVVIAILSVLLVGIGTSYAVFGVPDDVKGQDLVWPIMCAVNPTNTAVNNSSASSLNTNWAISELIGGSVDTEGMVTRTDCQICDVKSNCPFDFKYDWTPFQVKVDDCAALLARNPNAKAALLNTEAAAVALFPEGNSVFASQQFYIGYVKCAQDTGNHGNLTVANRFMNNVYVVDLPLGFASGFNGPSLESGTSSRLGESTGSFHVTAHDIFARYYVNNDEATFPNTWDWLMILMGRNQYGSINLTSVRTLNGDLYDENEHSASLNLSIPVELNIINIGEFLSGSPMFTGIGIVPSVDGVPATRTIGDTNVTFPKAGHFDATITESGSLLSAGPFTLTGTVNNLASGFDGTTFPYYSLFGWSYQRSQAASNILADFDVIHPVFRTYCSGAVPGTSGVGNEAVCSCSGNGC